VSERRAGPGRAPDGTQRREYVRSHTAPVEIELTFGGETQTGRLIDLSEGGLRCSVRGAIVPRAGDVVEVAIPLDERGLIDLDAELVSVERQDQVWVLAGRFLAIPTQDADRIRAYVFTRQLRERRRQAGLG
jgi:c-di-GMP-binding flagellar brake protein YcgR